MNVSPPFLGSTNSKRNDQDIGVESGRESKRNRNDSYTWTKVYKVSFETIRALSQAGLITDIDPIVLDLMHKADPNSFQIQPSAVRTWWSSILKKSLDCIIEYVHVRDPNTKLSLVENNEIQDLDEFNVRSAKIIEVFIQFKTHYASSDISHKPQMAQDVEDSKLSSLDNAFYLQLKNLAEVNLTTHTIVYYSGALAVTLKKPGRSSFQPIIQHFTDWIIKFPSLQEQLNHPENRKLLQSALERLEKMQMSNFPDLTLLVRELDVLTYLQEKLEIPHPKIVNVIALKDGIVRLRRESVALLAKHLDQFKLCLQPNSSEVPDQTEPDKLNLGDYTVEQFFAFVELFSKPYLDLPINAEPAEAIRTIVPMIHLAGFFSSTFALKSLFNHLKTRIRFNVPQYIEQPDKTLDYCEETYTLLMKSELVVEFWQRMRDHLISRILNRHMKTGDYTKQMNTILSHQQRTTPITHLNVEPRLKLRNHLTENHVKDIKRLESINRLTIYLKAEDVANFHKLIRGLLNLRYIKIILICSVNDCINLLKLHSNLIEIRFLKNIIIETIKIPCDIDVTITKEKSIVKCEVHETSLSLKSLTLQQFQTELFKKFPEIPKENFSITVLTPQQNSTISKQITKYLNFH